MSQHKIFCILWVFLALAIHPPLYAQTTTNVVAASPAPAGQAPDEVMQKLSGLVHAGKYPEAQKSVDVFMLLYPDDQRLPKMKELLEKRLASPPPANPAPSVSPPANNTVQTNAVPEQLKGMDKVEYNTLIELGREAQQTTDLDQQKSSLQQFMGKSKSFLEKHPNEMLIWQLRTASAISLDDAVAGYEAGQKLLASGGVDNDATVQRLLSQLNLKGWLDKEKIAEQQKQNKFAWVVGMWTGYYSYRSVSLPSKVDFTMSDSLIEGYSFNAAGEKFKTPIFRGTILDSGEIAWFSEGSKLIGFFKYAPSGLRSCEMVISNGTMTVVTHPIDGNKHPGTYALKRVGGSQNQQRQQDQLQNQQHPTPSPKRESQREK